MRLRLDTQVVLWQLAGVNRIGPNARAAIADAQALEFSVVSLAEIGAEASVGKLTVPSDFEPQLDTLGLQILGLGPRHCLAVAELPLHHRDPFDRLLLAQAQIEGISVLSADSRFGDYDIDLVPAAE